jgi:gamma-glutamyltranspeptidase/glutathione hydrolase
LVTGWFAFSSIHAADATHGMVASAHPLATQAGVNALKSGGNAIDAAVAVGLTLGVVDGHNSGIGGGCFMLIRRANGEFIAIDGREKAPATASRDMFLRDGKADTKLSQTGALASGVPGEIAAFDYAIKHFGRKKFADVLLPAAIVAENGFELSGIYDSRLRANAAELASFEASRAIFFRDGKLLVKGDVLKQADLAATYRALAEQGSDWFYRGPFATNTALWMKTHGGLITVEDFANYRIELREPIRSRYRGYDVVSFPPPSSGGVHVAQMLNILERFDLKSFDEPTRLHVLTEAMKLAFADRAYWLGDPDFAKVPRGLVAQEYGDILAGMIDVHRAIDVPRHGLPPRYAEDFFPSKPGTASSATPSKTASIIAVPVPGAAASEPDLDKHTTHFSVADAEGNWVACTATVNTGFGSKVVVPGTGVLLNNQMDDFSVQPGVANYFGLVGAEANAIAPGKRPLSSMSPTIVLKGGQPIIALGAAGGPKIISAVLLELVAMLDLGQTPQQAVAAPRIHQQWSPDEIMVERTLPEARVRELELRGHKVRVISAGSTSHIVARSRDGKGFTGAADPRGSGTAEGW